ncbi:hypothetical protein N7532_005940 [Penicillium argentinense]|uniref:Uncharacterized protein n=1 Tax=Penicillium argentinense TaxID=1131581 RepID=A0A9W9KAA9_9EURO|nr:uncharacterized protein N7532_005940 [Penicillium argentinense]KAJ5098939.1 hypothetical protein N7532_005940 [Penicillium argentinense]
MTSPTTILLLGTCDTKLPELLYTKSAITSSQTFGTIKVLMMDIGHGPSTSTEVDIKQSDLLSSAAEPQAQMSTLDRDTYIQTLSTHAASYISNLHQQGLIHGILGIGGSCGTSLATTAMREGLPVGFPKLMVSTMASGDVSPYIGETDIGMMYSVVDIAGRNRVLEMVLRNAGGAIAGMATSYHAQLSEFPEGKTGVRIGISMFGVTTPAVTVAREHLESILPGCEVYVFHATGSGGRAMERLIGEKQLDAVLDLTTTEMADEVVGGVLSAGPERLTAATRRDIPRVVSVGACDMVNFGKFESIPERFAGDTHTKRKFHRHNPTVSLMRTTGEECAEIARRIARNISGKATAQSGCGKVTKTRVLLPTGGVSMIDVPGQPFWDPETDEVLFKTLEKELQGTGIEVVRDEREVNDSGFAVRAAEMLRDLIESCSN